MDSNQHTKLVNVVSEIKALHEALNEYGDKFRGKVAELEKADSNEGFMFSDTYWVFVAYADALMRLRLIVEQNFHFIETLSTLAVTRYIFELMVWLRALARDHRYGLTYYFQLMEKQVRYYEDRIKITEREIALLNRLEAEESAEITATSKTLVKAREDAKKALPKLFQGIWSENDRKARRNFSMYADQAKTNGFGYQAALLEKQLLPQLRALLDTCRAELAKSLRSAKGKPPVGERWERQERDWKWKQQAALVGMSDQFEFIYSFTSRLLHATPVSLTTNQKLLEPDEMHLLVEYVYVSLLDAMDLAKQILGEPIGDISVH